MNGQYVKTTSSATGMMQKATMMAPFFQSRLWVLNGISLAETATASVGAVVMMLSFLDYGYGKETGGRSL